MSYNPKQTINTQEHGNPFDTLEQGLEWLFNQAETRGYEAEISGQVNISGITRYAVNQVTQHTDINNLSFNLKLVEGKRMARASTTLLGKPGLEQLFDKVETNLRKSPEISFYQGLPEARKGETVDLSGVAWSIEDRADTVIEAVNAAQEIDGTVITAGTASSTISYTHLMSTQGIDVEDSGTTNYFKINAILGPPEARGYGQEEIYWRYDRPEITDMATNATQTSRDTLQLKTMDAQEYEVLLGPQAVSDLLVFVLFSADPVSFHESNSFTSDNLGAQIFDELLTIHDLPRNPREANIVRSFDAEGIPTTNQVFIDAGVLKFVPYDSFFAAKYLDDKNMVTGHALGQGAFPVSASVESGNKSLEEQISEVEDGLYIKNFWYNRFTKRREGGLTGLTRNGLYHVKDGEITGAVRNLRYTESFVRAFGPGNIVSLSKEKTKYNLANVPSIHLNKFNFSSVAHTTQQLE